MSQQPKQPDIFDNEDEDPANDPPNGTWIAPDEPMGSHAHGLTTREARQGETFDERNRHTESEDSEVDVRDEIGSLVQDGDEDVDDVDDDSTMAAWTQADEGDLSAEELAMHRIDTP
jgi:hypothetical protein